MFAIANGGVGASQLDTTGVVAGVYGNGSNVPTVTVDANGRVTSVTTSPVVAVGYVPEGRTVTAGTGLLGGGSLAGNITLSLNLATATPQALGIATAGVSIAAARGDHVHPAVDLSDTNETQGSLPLGRGGTGDALSPVAGAVVYSTGSKFALTNPGMPGQVLTSGGTDEPVWTTIVGTGTVTSVNASGGTTGMTFTGGPVTTIGTLTLGGTLLPDNGGTGLTATPTNGQLLIGDGLGYTLAALTAGTAVSITNAAGSITIDNTAPDQIVSLTGAGTTSISGTYPNFTITSNDQFGGTVTSVAASGGATGLTFSGSPITSAGTLTLGGTLSATSGGTGLSAAPANGQLAIGNGTGYSLSTITAGSGVSVTNAAGSITIANTAPDQIVSLTAGTAISVTGTYPSFTVANTAPDQIVSLTGAGTTSISGTYPNFTITSNDQFGGTVTSVAASGGATGLTFSGSPITSAGTLTLGGTLAVASGGTGASNAGAARTALGAAALGANTDITSIALTSGTIQNAPTSGTDIVNKAYADSIASGINFHQAVRLATVAALPAYTYNNGSSGVGATITANANGALSIDGVAVVAGNRVLIKDEVGAAQANHGVYVVTQTGNGSTPFILTRATDFDSTGTGVDQIDAGDFFLVTAGATQSNTSWVQQTPLPITVGTTPIIFSQFGAPVLYTAGTGLSLAGTVFSITNTGVSASTYGSASSVPVIAVNAQGQITSASSTSISIAASQITSGAVAVGTGGTGLTATPTNGQLLIGNGTGYSLSTLTAGTGVSVTNGSGSVTVTNTAPDQIVTLTGGGGTSISGAYPNFTITSTTGVGTVTSVDVSGGSTGLSFTGGPITSSGIITMGGTLAVANGGTGATSLSSGFLLKGNGTSAVSASVIFDNGTNVGIGTSSPATLLDVNGVTTFRGSTNQTSGAHFTSNGEGLWMNGFASYGAGITSDAAGTAVRLWTSGSERVRITAGGDVGIGTSSPGSELDVFKAKTGTVSVSVGNNVGAPNDSARFNLNYSGTSLGSFGYTWDGGAFYNTLDYFGYLAITRQGVERIRIDSSGNLVVGGTAAQGTSAGRGNITINGSSQSILSFSNGGSLAGYVLHDGADLWVNNVGVGAQRFYTNGAERMRIASDGNIAIGTATTADWRLRIEKADAQHLLLFNTAGNGTRINMADQSWQGEIEQSGGSLLFKAGGTVERMRVSSDGNVGIGTNSPGFALDVATTGARIRVAPSTNTNSALFQSTNAGGNAFIGLDNNSGGLGGPYTLNMWHSGAYPIVFATNNAERMRITSAGNVGIGTNVPASPLHVSGAAAGGGISTTIANTDATGFGGLTFVDGGASVRAQIWVGNGSYASFGGASSINYSANGGPHVWYTNYAERMRITAAGDVGIGTSSPVGGGLLTVGSGSGASAALQYLNAGTGGSALVGRVSGNNTWLVGDTVTAFGSGTGLVNFVYGDNPWVVATNSSEKMRVTGGGNVGIGTSSPVTRLTVGDGAITAGASGDVLIGRFNTTFPTSGAGYFRLRTNNTDAENGGITFDTLLSGTLTERARIDAIGNMSLGNSAVPYIAAGRTVFSVNGASSALIGLQSAGANRGYLYADGSVLALEAESPCILKLNAIGAQPMTFFTSNTERARIDSAGNVGIGTSSPGARLEVAGGDARIHGLTVGRGGSGVLSNTAMGIQALLANTTGAANTAMGLNALVNNTTGNNQTALGHQTLFSNTTGGQNTAVGQNALVLNTTGNSNTATGFQALLNNTTGSNNIAAGADALFANTTGNNNTAIGVGAGSALTTGSNNTIIGRVAGTAGLDSTVIIAAGVTERMRIDSGGLVGIGTSSPGSYPYGGLLNVAGGISMALGNRLGWGITDSFTLNGVTTAHYGFTYGGSTNLVTMSGYFGVNFATLGLERMRIDTSGRMGINSSAPGTILQASDPTSAASSSTITRGSNFSGLTLTTPNNGNNMVGIFFGTGPTTAGSHWSGITGNRSDAASHWGTHLSFYTHANDFSAIDDANERMRIDGNGNVGIGTTSPASLLHVKRGSNATEVYPTGTWAARVINATDAAGENGLLVGNRWAGTGSTVFEVGSIFGGGTGSWFSYYRIDGVGQSIWSNQGTERMRLDTGGNLLVGRSSASSGTPRLDVYRAGGGVVGRIAGNSGAYLSISAEGVRDWWIANGVTSGSDGVFGIYDATATATRFVIDTSGNVGIGTTSPAVRLHVASTGNTTARIDSTNGQTPELSLFSNGVYDWRIRGGTSLSFTVDATERMRISSAGGLSVGTTTDAGAGAILASGNITAFSDIRLKDNIEQISGALDRVSRIRGVTYTRNDLEDTDRRYAGVIAQEIEQVLPEAVFDSGEMKAVDYNATIGLLIEAVKELTARVAELEGN